MKITKHTIGRLLLAFISIASFISCTEDFPGNVESDKYTDLKSIRIVNAGASGQEILEGQINQNTKSITFPRIDTLSDFENIKFEAITSEGSKLEKEIFEIPYQSGDTQREIILKVTNLPRFKEYKAIIRFKVPVYGANLDAPSYYDYSSNALGNPIYPSLATANTRGTGFDGNHVLIIERGGAGVHLLEVNKLKNNVIERIPLNMEGVTGGTLTVNMGAQAHGHSYVANLSGAHASPLKLYHWSDPSKAPDVVANINVGSLAGAAVRHGDTFSINIDKNGNGYAYFMASSQIIRLKITNFKEGSEPTVITSRINYEQWGHYSQIGTTESYIISGHSQPFSLVNNGASASYTMKVESLPKSLTDIKIFTFNGTRYLLGITVPRGAPNGTSATMYLYNINRGSNIVDALTALEQTAIDGKVAPHIFSFEVGTTVNISPGTQAGYHIIKDASGKDEKLMLYGATSQGGFAIIEFGVAVAED
ncbi:MULTISPECIES: DUF4623 domain-containing protein [Sphingobacterium]|uniref:DUF4623 domain-containing protein n=1 Tax=Sphingobacterium litopenaei TaxID=2763500 RepID=A0ABR7YH93_9SPHI|nr:MULTISPECIES: DUF4623 domain-containing protein [Sphingobacterium]MBD1430655.1 DUF4623 domain-containing protein [Sphingobacterium litopenaei]